MTYDELIAHYGSPAQAAAARGLDRQVLHGWKSRGSIPLEQQLQYELLTDGALKADISPELRKVLAA
jgi:hypothetical protein